MVKLIPNIVKLVNDVIKPVQKVYDVIIVFIVLVVESIECNIWLGCKLPKYSYLKFTINVC